MIGNSSLKANIYFTIRTQRVNIKGVTAKISPNEFFTSKITIYTFVGSVGVFNVNTNMPGEK